MLLKIGCHGSVWQNNIFPVKILARHGHYKPCRLPEATIEQTINTIWPDCYLRQGDRLLNAPSKANFLRILLDLSGPYWPIRTHMGPYGPVWGRNPPGKTYFFSLNKSLSKIVVFDLHMTSFAGFIVFFRFLAEMRFRTIIKLPQKASSRTKTCSFGTSCTLP